ncbi:multidrug ABC transporter ATP-binding protein [Clostridia bacterium]|nr:multidrug ABC transporter ATP-binding protein [Clostridia bacterium]
MSKVLTYLKPYIGMLLCAIALLFVQAMCDLALPDYMSKIVNTGVISGNIPFIWQMGFKMLGITLLGTASSVTVGYFAARIASLAGRDLRYDVFGKVERFSSAEFDKFSTASLITRTTNDITQIQNLAVMAVRMIFYAPIIAIGGVTKAISKSPSMSWILAIAVLSLICCIMLLLLMVMPKMRLAQKLVDRLNLVTRENIEGMLVTRAFNSQRFEQKRFDTANTELTANNLFVNRAMSAMMPALTLVMTLTTVFIVWIGAHQVSEFRLDPGSMMAYMQYAMQVIMAFVMLSVMFILIPRAAVSADRIAEVLAIEPIITDPESPETYGDRFTGEVEFEDVSFRYPESDGDVLRHISFKAKPGKTTAFIGATGSGKSTVVNLIVRFYDVTGGRIKVGGKDVRAVNQKDLRANIGYVPQKSVLFSGTIDSNLRYADRGMTAQNIERAASVAQATEFIESKPERYETPIAQGGGNVSGGQKQRLSIARALAKNAPIYIFDDSFSALDVKTDRKLRAALKEQTGDSTILLVAQRVSSIMDADQIVVLDNGEIVGVGTHRELLKTCEVYYEIAASQLSEEELAR